ncbi:MAG: ATP-binding cassette domain-containing protein, partial [Bryobacterales bacterium]|nr:ATP-binding cassette domain-containing protein [Bryobacterales bacterium]
MAKVAFNAVSKSYSSCSGSKERLRELLVPGRARRRAEFWALRDVSFEVSTGETLCLIGANGSGKSTSLQLAAGILRPTAGSVEVKGRVAALLELGAGFHPEFSGRENARLSAALFGLSACEFRQRCAQIEEVAEIGDFIDRPVQTSSSGMRVRLAFAVAIHVEPEVL